MMGSSNSKNKQPSAQLSTTSDSSSNPPPQVSAPVLPTTALPQNDHTNPTESTNPIESAQSLPDQVGTIPGKKQLQVLKVNNPEDYEDDTNQTGQSIYELKVQDSYYSTPNRPRSRVVTEAMEAARVKKLAKAEKKAEKVAKKKSKKPDNSLPSAPGTVPWVIENAKRLGVLNLSKMNLEAVPDVTFESVPGTTRVINVSSNSMTQLDARLCDYVLVQRLIANDNLLTAIPAKISRMTALKTLDLSSNKLTALPDAFQTMIHLNHVDLSGNQLTELPPSFAELELKVLHLAHNKFASAPIQIVTMDGLEELDLSHNQLSVYPSEYTALKSIRQLNLDTNKLSDFPDDMFMAYLDLIKLSIRDNPLKMSTLEAKQSYKNFAERRRTRCKRLIDIGTLSLDDLVPADS